MKLTQDEMHAILTKTEKHLKNPKVHDQIKSTLEQMGLTKKIKYHDILYLAFGINLGSAETMKSIDVALAKKEDENK